MDLVLTDDSEPDSPVKTADLKTRQPRVNSRRLPSPLSPFQDESASPPPRSARRPLKKNIAGQPPVIDSVASPNRLTAPGTPSYSGGPQVDFSSAEGISSILKSPLVAYQTVLSSPLGTNNGATRLPSPRVSSPPSVGKYRRPVVTTVSEETYPSLGSSRIANTAAKPFHPARIPFSPKKSSFSSQKVPKKKMDSLLSSTAAKKSSPPSRLSSKNPSPLVGKSPETPSLSSSKKSFASRQIFDSLPPSTSDAMRGEIITAKKIAPVPESLNVEKSEWKEKAIELSSTSPANLAASEVLVDSEPKEVDSGESADSHSCWSIEKFSTPLKTNETEKKRIDRRPGGGSHSGTQEAKERSPTNVSSTEKLPTTRESAVARVENALKAVSVESELIQIREEQIQLDSEAASANSRKKKRRNLGMSAENLVTIQMYSDSASSAIGGNSNSAVVATGCQEPIGIGAAVSVPALAPLLLQPVAGLAKETSLQHLRDATAVTTVMPEPHSSISPRTKKRKRLSISNEAATTYACAEPAFKPSEDCSSETGSTNFSEEAGLEKRTELEVRATASEDSGPPPQKKKRAKLSMCSDIHVTSVFSSR